jgi:hypothetical protein
MPQIQRVRDQPGRGARRHRQHRTQLGRRELRHLRGAGTTQRHQSLTARQGHPVIGTLQHRMEVSPVRCVDQDPHLCLLRNSTRCRDIGQQTVGVKVGRLGFEDETKLPDHRQNRGEFLVVHKGFQRFLWVSLRRGLGTLSARLRRSGSSEFLCRTVMSWASRNLNR